AARLAAPSRRVTGPDWARNFSTERRAASTRGRSRSRVPVRGARSCSATTPEAARPWARNSPAAKRRGSRPDEGGSASVSARAARCSNRSSRRSAAALTGDVAIPGGVVEARPRLGHGALYHPGERARLGDGQIDVPEHQEEEEDEGHVVHDPCGLAEG